MKDALSLDALAKQFDDFVNEAHRLKALYASRITLLVGLETEFITSADLEHLEELLKVQGDRIEYVVGSIHHVNSIPIDFDSITFDKSLRSFSDGDDSTAATSMGRFLSAYFDAQYQLLNRFRPEIIGHLDLCRLYNPDLKFRDFPAAWEKLVRNVKFAVDYGALFEFNAASLRKGWQDAYPAEDVVEVSGSVFDPEDF